MKPIEIVSVGNGYTVHVHGDLARAYGARKRRKPYDGAVTRIPSGGLDIVAGAEPAVVDAEQAKSLAHLIGRCKLGFGDLVFAYTSAPAGFFDGE